MCGMNVGGTAQTKTVCHRSLLMNREPSSSLCSALRYTCVTPSDQMNRTNWTFVPSRQVDGACVGKLNRSIRRTLRHITGHVWWAAEGDGWLSSAWFTPKQRMRHISPSANHQSSKQRSRYTRPDPPARLCPWHQPGNTQQMTVVKSRSLSPIMRHSETHRVVRGPIRTKTNIWSCKLSLRHQTSRPPLQYETLLDDWTNKSLRFRVWLGRCVGGWCGGGGTD